MIDLNDMPPQADKSLLDRLARVDTATIGHFIFEGAMSPSIRPLNTKLKLAGQAITLSLEGLDSALLHHATGLLREGDVLVIDRCGDDRHACVGGGVGLAIALSKGAGVIVDGPATDYNEVMDLQLPIWCTGISPITTRNIGKSGRMNTPITCGGINVRPGDLVLADDSGVLCIPPADAESLIERAEAKEARAPLMAAALRSGQLMGERTGATAKIMETLEQQRSKETT